MIIFLGPVDVVQSDNNCGKNVGWGGEEREEKCVLRQNLTDSNGKGGNGDSSILDARMRYGEQSQQTCLFPDK